MSMLSCYGSCVGAVSQAEKMEQEELEEGTQFLGLVVLQNAVRASSYRPLEQLHAVGITPVMLTGGPRPVSRHRQTDS